MGVVAVSRPEMEIPEGLDREHFLQAFKRFDVEGFPTRFKTASTYHVWHEGKGYPPPAIAAYAVEECTGAMPKGFRAGENTRCFRAIRNAGFQIRKIEFAPTSDRDELETRAAEILEGGWITDQPPEGNRDPERTTSNSPTYAFIRDPEVVAWVRKQSNFHCELCGESAPFKSEATKLPYLEVHHVVPLADDGPDTHDNAVALCPNCHRRCHLSTDSATATNELYERVPRLHRPS
jgi:hypothetical protein